MDKTDSQIIDDLGGNEGVAELCGEISAGAVSQWRRRGIPPGWRRYLRSIRPAAFAPSPAGAGKQGAPHA